MTQQRRSAMRHEPFDVGRIRCQGCERVIRTLLAQVDGAESVETDRRSGVVNVSYHAEVVSRARLITHLNELGYQTKN